MSSLLLGAKTPAADTIGPGTARSGQRWLAGRIFDFGARFQPVHGRGSSANTVNAPGFLAHMATVAVDPETGSVKVRDYVAARMWAER
jgi:CO/xanthine dehydrogenase Mo-binding subunit